ncbi:MAG: ferric iron uptake transcriptional regulator [Gammaproteobacteria bacterium]|nr:MAG: ferric iron uptake transcriptional regulator [Gammaproteobacteria bacterium]
MDLENLKQAGLKITVPRLKILHILHSGCKRHFTVDEIYQELIKQKASVGLATVYRVLAQFEACNLVSRVQLYNDQATFEAGQDRDHHDHMICIKCGKIVEFCDDIIEERQEKIAKKYGFKLKKHHMVLFCKCQNGCKNKEK